MKQKRPPPFKFIRIPWNAKKLKCPNCGTEERVQNTLLKYRFELCASCRKEVINDAARA